MWSITSYYNPARFKRRLSNYRIFRASLATPLVTVELSFDGKFELNKQDADVLVQISGGAMVWQKERLLNLALRSVPADVNAVAWLDCDMIFERPDWVAAARQQLINSNITQLFSEILDLGPSDHRPPVQANMPPSVQGIVSSAQTPLNMANWAGAQVGKRGSGGAWAARREMLEEHGFYDAMIAGGGDRAFGCALYGEFETLTKLYDLNAARRAHYLRWARPMHRAIGGRLGFVGGRLFHLWHGAIENRNYAARHIALAKYGFEPDVDLKIGSNGAWQWKRPRPDLEDFFANYFKSRAEDG